MVPASAVRAEKRQLFSLEKFKATISAATFDRSSLSIVELFQYQWGWNISYEAVAINEYLKAGWDYWERAANQNAIYCDKALAQSDYQRECVAVIRLRTTKSSWEPVGFERGIAVCYTDRQRLFYVGCSLVTMETRRRQYVKAYVGPPMGMGGGAFVNDIGMFRLTCDFKVGAVNDKLAAVKRHFEFGGQYSLGKALQINAPAGFRLFASGGVTRWGIVVMQAKADASETRITFTFVGRWGTQNVNDDNWPVFKDPDVEIFKRMFEEVVGRNTCNKDAAPSISTTT